MALKLGYWHWDIVLYCPSPLERSYKPRVLQHYPDITSWSHFNPEALSRLCLPQGLKYTLFLPLASCLFLEFHLLLCDV